ncbi:hypothetical protein HALA3H3_890014 [Halomonas sp. A3H3]|nr:hypothetical protein HALA3H3_890014 [Halomonas sp. A3H3]
MPCAKLIQEKESSTLMVPCNQ